MLKLVRARENQKPSVALVLVIVSVERRLTDETTNLDTNDSKRIREGRLVPVGVGCRLEKAGGGEYVCREQVASA